MNKYFFYISILLLVGTQQAAAKDMFRIYLKDKNGTKYNLNQPSQFLSERALDRRSKQYIEVNESDLPLSTQYIERIEQLNFKIIAKSKWLNTVCIAVDDSIDIARIKNETFISDIVWVGKSTLPKNYNAKHPIKTQYPSSKNTTYYGYASDQIYMVNGQVLHEKGYWGKDKEIAVIDAGFSNLREILYLGNITIKGIKDFTGDGIDILKSSEHGISVLSAMATNQPNTFVGTAPKASYWLLKSESGRYEYPIEEDYWISAIEYADSVGVDIVNTSLGYHEFDAPAISYTPEQMDGKSSVMSRAADIATKKGIVVVASAGNEGNTTWKKITIPADAQNVLTIGSVSRDSTVSSFSSIGSTADGRIKPDVVALGEKINLLDARSEIIVTNGTSFATPVITGLTACLWEAFPSLTSIQLINIIRSSGYYYNKPGNTYGYGIPDMSFAVLLANDITTGIEDSNNTTPSKSSLLQYSSDSIGRLNIRKTNTINDNEIYYIQIYNIDGRLLAHEILDGYEKTIHLNKSSRQSYIIYITSQNYTESKKLLF